jgi:NAD-dependent SIR2 family protein deacetylase
MEYEFTVFLEIDAEHIALGAKDRTSMFDQRYFTITPDVGKKLMQWLEGGVEKTPVVLASTLEKTEKDDALKTIKQQIVDRCKQLGGSKNSELMELLVQYAPNKNPNSITSESKLNELSAALDNMINVSDKTSDKTDKNSE